MDEIDECLEKSCQVFELGKIVSPPEQACGGRLHQVWRITTTIGRFAVKILNERIMQKENICSAYEQSERTARSFANLGVPAVPALLKEGKCVHFVGNRAAMIYVWIEGKANPIGNVDELCARTMGEVLGTIHACNLDASEFRPKNSSVAPDQLQELISEAKLHQQAFSEILDANNENINDWSRKANDAVAILQDNLVLSHGDLDQHNVIWSNDLEPVIIDWESAGLQNPTVELLNLCLDWSGFPDRVPDKSSFLACFNGYNETNTGKTVLDQFDTAFDGELAYFLNWLAFSLTRLIEVDGEEKEIAVSESKNALRSLCLLDECRSILLDWLN